MSVHQKSGIISEIKVVQKLSIKKCFYQKIDNLNSNIFFEKFSAFLTMKIDFESMILALFDKPYFINGFFFKFSFEYVNSWSKILLFRTQHLLP